MILSGYTDTDLFSRFHSKVRGYIYGKVGDTCLADDLTSDVFLKVYERSGSYDESKASVSTWIYTVARNTVIDYFRTRKTYSEIPETTEDNIDVEGQIINNETLEILADALESLQERERDIVILHYYAGMTLKDIADRMGISYSYIKILHSRTLTELRQFFNL